MLIKGTKKTQKGSVMLQALIVTMMVAILIGSVGSYVLNSARGSQHSRQLENFQNLAHALSAYVADPNLCINALRFSPGNEVLNPGDAMDADGTRVFFRQVKLPNWIEYRDAGNSTYNFVFWPYPMGARNVPNYATATAPENIGPGEFRIQELRFIARTQEVVLGGTEYHGDLALQAIPVNRSNFSQVLQDRAMPRRVIARLMVKVNSANNLLACSARVSEEWYCSSMGCTYDANANPGDPECSCPISDFSCPAGSYIRDFDTAGPVCEPLNIIPCPPGFYADGIWENQRMACKSFDCPLGTYRSGNFCVPGGTPAPTPTGTPAPTTPAPTVAAGCWVYGWAWTGSTACSSQCGGNSCSYATEAECTAARSASPYISNSNYNVSSCTQSDVGCSNLCSPTPPLCDVCESGYSDVIAGRSWQSCGHVYNAFTDQCEVTAWQSNSLPAYPCQYIGGNPDGDPGPISYAPQPCLSPPGPRSCSSVPGNVSDCTVDGQVLVFENDSCCCENTGLFGGFTRGESYCEADGSGGFNKRWRCQTGVLGSTDCSSGVTP